MASSYLRRWYRAATQFGVQTDGQRIRLQGQPDFVLRIFQLAGRFEHVRGAAEDAERHRIHTIRFHHFPRRPRVVPVVHQLHHAEHDVRFLEISVNRQRLARQQACLCHRFRWHLEIEAEVQIRRGQIRIRRGVFGIGVDRGLELVDRLHHRRFVELVQQMPAAEKMVVGIRAARGFLHQHFAIRATEHHPQAGDHVLRDVRSAFRARTESCT